MEENVARSTIYNRGDMYLLGKRSMGSLNVSVPEYAMGGREREQDR